jgi:hypothetical protein
MTDEEFGAMAYGMGPARQIRDRLLQSAIHGEPVGAAESAVVRWMRPRPNKTEATWLKKYDAARAQMVIAETKGGGQ